MKLTVKSRYGDSRYFEIKNDHILLTFESVWCSIGMGENDELSFVDPDGGPFVSVGSNLKEFHKDLPYKTITKIEKAETGYKLHYEQ